MSKLIKKYKNLIFIVTLVLLSSVAISNDLLNYSVQYTNSTSDYFGELFMSIFVEAFVSIHMTVFVFKPLASTTANPKENTKKMFITRVIILLVCDLLFPPSFVAGIDFMLVFIGAFIAVPIRLSTFNNINNTQNNNNYSNMQFDNDMKFDIEKFDIKLEPDVKYELSTCLVNYLFALSEKDKDMIKNVTTNKMYDDTLKIIETSNTYNKKNVIDNVNIKYFDILFRNKNNNDEIIHADIMLSAVDYMEYASTAINGRCNENYRYKVIFRKKHTDNTKVEKVDICPYCGASVDGNKEFCDYCGNMLVEKKNEWLIEKLEKTLLR